MKMHGLPDYRVLARAFLALVVALQLAALPAHAVTGTVEGGRINPLPIAIAPFLVGEGAEEAGTTVSSVITNNLGRSGYFNPLDPASFIEQLTSFEKVPDFASWRQIQAKALVTEIGRAHV